MDLRSYDPAIGRFNGIDPVTHHSQGTSVAFDNNPIFFADPSGADGTTFINDGSTGFANAWNSLKQESKTWSDNSGGCDDCSKCPETCNDNDPPIKTEHLDEVFITNLKRSAVHKDFNWTGDPKTDWLNYIAYKSYWSNHFKGFSQAFDAGWKSWMPGDLGYDVMNFSSLAIGGTLLTVAGGGIAGSYFGFQGLGAPIYNGAIYYSEAARWYGFQGYFKVNAVLSSQINGMAGAAATLNYKYGYQLHYYLSGSKGVHQTIYPTIRYNMNIELLPFLKKSYEVYDDFSSLTDD